MSFRSFPKQISVPMPVDETGMIGRECPSDDCLGYFKLQMGTGLQGEGLPCHCPYCGHEAPPDNFFTQEQIEYAKSVAFRQIASHFSRELKKMEFDHKPRGNFGIGVSLKVEEGSPPPIRHYRERRLETEIICESCTLRYAVYGVFAYCPDCGAHNSSQILDRNLNLVLKELELASEVGDETLREHLEADALATMVAAFDGFGREICRVNAGKVSSPTQANSISFQSISSANKKLISLFKIDCTSLVSLADWNLAQRCFQKRHLFAHNLGVVDQKYLDTTSDTAAVLGRKISISQDEIRSLVSVISFIGKALAQALAQRA